MKKWNRPELSVLDIAATANGKNHNKYEGIDGVDAHGEYNKYINKNGYGTFVVPTDDNNDDHKTDVEDDFS